MSAVIVENRNTLLNGTSKTSNPFSSNSDLSDMIRNLGDIDRAIAGLADLSSPAVDAAVNNAMTAAGEDFGIFTRFVDLVRNTRLEEASQELSRMLQVPLDRVITATRFFARTLKTDTTLPRQLGDLWEKIAEMSETDAIRTIMKLFGFQAVESKMAIQSLWARSRAASGLPQVERPVAPMRQR